MLRAIVILVAPVLAFVAGVVAIAVHAVPAYELRQAQAAYAQVRADAAQARSDAVAAVLDQLQAIAAGQALEADARQLHSAAGGMLDVTALAAELEATDRLAQVLAAPSAVERMPAASVPGTPAELIAAAEATLTWIDEIEAVGREAAAQTATVQSRHGELEEAVASLAATAETSGAATLGATTKADAGSRDRLTAAIAALGAADRASTFDALTEYLAASTAATTSHAAAVAAEEAAAAAAAAGRTGSGSNGGGSTGRSLLEGFNGDICSIRTCIDRGNPPTVYFYGQYIGWTCPYYAWATEQFMLNDGEVVDYLPAWDEPYAARVIPLLLE